MIPLEPHVYKYGIKETKHCTCVVNIYWNHFNIILLWLLLTPTFRLMSHRWHQIVDEVRSDESNNSVHVHDAQSRQRRDDAHHVSFRDTPSPVTRRSSFDRTNNNPHGSQNTLYNHGDNHYNHFMPPPPPPIYHTRIKPDMYDGNSSYEQYASHFEDCSELSGWDNRTKVLMLAASLRGAARSFYMCLTEDERRNYITLTTHLSAAFR